MARGRFYRLQFRVGMIVFGSSLEWLVRLQGRLGKAGAWLTRPWAPPIVAAAAPANVPARLSETDQWLRVAGILEDAQTRAGTVFRRQIEAQAQIDAATYALQRLREEIAPALMGPGLGLGLAPVRAVPAQANLARTPFRRRLEPLAA